MIARNKRKEGLLGFVLIMLLVLGARAAQDLLAAPVRIDHAAVEGNKITAADVILREIPFTFPAVLSAADLTLVQNKVQNLGLFNRVELRVDERDGQAVLTVIVTESWYLFPSPLFSISDRDWSKLSYGLQVTDANFRGRNERLRVGGSFGYNPSYFLNYSIPWIGERQRLSLNIGISRRANENRIFDFQEDRLGFNLGLGKRLSLELETGVQFSLTRIRLPGQYGIYAVSGQAQDIVPSLSWQVRWDHRDLAEYPRKGAYLAIELQRTGFGKNQPDFWRLTSDSRFYQPFLGALSLGVRQLFILNSGILPMYDRVYLGYGERLRGYFDQILPNPALFADYKSYSISLTSLEIRIPLLPVRYFSIKNGPIIPSLYRNLKFGLSAGLFVDSGIVWRTASEIRWNNFLTGYGVGLHIILPYINVLRIEYALNKLGHGQFIIDAGISF